MEKTKQTKIGEIPESWNLKTLKEGANISSGNSAPQENSFFINGKFPFCRTSDVAIAHISDNFYEIKDYLNEDGIKGLKLYKKGTILMPKNGLLNHRVLLSINSYVSSHLAIVCSYPKKFNTKFLFYFLLGIDSKNLTSTQDYPSLKLEEIKKVKIPHPPLSEQKKIAAVLNKIKRNIKIKDELIKKTQELKRSTMKYLFTYGTKVEKTIQTEIGKIPESWDVKSFSELCSFSTGKNPARNMEIYWDNGTFRWLTISDMKQGQTISKTKEKVSQQAIVECFKGKYVKKGTLLMSLKPTIGRTCFAGCDLVHNEDIISINPKKELNKTFISYYLPILDYKQYEDRQIKGHTLNKAKISKIQIPLPSLPEQKKIASILSKLDERIKNYEEQKTNIQTLFKSMLSKLTTGQIRVHNLDIDTSEVEQ